MVKNYGTILHDDCPFVYTMEISNHRVGTYGFATFLAVCYNAT